MNYTKLSLTIVSCFAVTSCFVGLSVARADPMPVEGTRELRLSNAIMDITSSGGSGLAVLSPEHGSNTTVVQMGGGAGYFVSDHVEVGATVGYIYQGSGSSSSATAQGPGFDLFLRLYSKPGAVGIFLEPVLEFQYLKTTMTIGSNSESVSEEILGPGADIGVEVFLADSWAIRVGPSFRYYKIWASAENGGSGDTSATKFGLAFGISAYF